MQVSMLDPDRAIWRVCATTRDNLTPQQWHADIPEAPFRPLC